MELNEEIPVNLVDEERLVNITILSGSIFVPLPDVSAKNRLVNVSREDMLAVCQNLFGFLRHKILRPISRLLKQEKKAVRPLVDFYCLGII